jgi:hypothetical protein
MRSKETTGVRSDLVHDSDSLSDDVLELVVVVLELSFLEEDKLGTLRDLDTDTSEALSFTDQSEDLSVEVDIELQVLIVSDEESSLETSLSTVNLLLPFLSPHVFIGEKSVTERVVVSHVLSGVSILALKNLLWELFHGH